MLTKPNITCLDNGDKYWTQSFDTFDCKVYVPRNELPSKVINYGFQAPYLMVFEEEVQSVEDAICYAEKMGLSAIARAYATSVVFIYPRGVQSWENAPKDLFANIIHESRISQYYEDGLALMWNRFDKCWGEYYIRGAVLRTCIYAKGKAADYVAANCLQTINGDGLYGPGDITPVVCTLENLSGTPVVSRNDIAVVSVGNDEQINIALSDSVDEFLVADSADYESQYNCFGKNYRRMMGHFENEQDLNEIDMQREELVFNLTTSSDNQGDDKDTRSHDVGVVAYYNKKLFEKYEKVPIVFCFHGGGDSAMCMSNLSGWYRVAHDYDFLLVSIENHLNSTATEMMELLVKLEEMYPIDSERIYSTGFSMGGCKTWDMYQEYPSVFAAVAPMDATFEVGLNSYGEKSPKLNKDILVPVFYAGGEITPLPELPFQEEKCLNRMKYVLEVNKADTTNNVKFEDRENWKDKIWGIEGDKVTKLEDTTRNSVLTMNHFMTQKDKCYCVFASISGQGHEVRHHTCENAWKFMSQFRRLSDGSII